MSEATALAIVERVITQGDLAKLTAPERVSYYVQTCTSLGLNPLTKPFDYLQLNGKLVLYANRTCADQLRELRKVSLTIAARERIGEVYVVTARATMPDGRTDESTGAVDVKGKAGEALANALMKAETKAKRRVTLSICGLGWTDETEVESIPDAKKVTVTVDGEVLGAEPASNGNGNGKAKPQVVPSEDDLNGVLRLIEDAKSFEELDAIHKLHAKKRWAPAQGTKLNKANQKRRQELEDVRDGDGGNHDEHAEEPGREPGDDQ